MEVPGRRKSVQIMEAFKIKSNLRLYIFLARAGFLRIEKEGSHIRV